MGRKEDFESPAPMKLDAIAGLIAAHLKREDILATPDLAASAGIDWFLSSHGAPTGLSLKDQRILLGMVVDRLAGFTPPLPPEGEAADGDLRLPRRGRTRQPSPSFNDRISEISRRLMPIILQTIDFGRVSALSPEEQRAEIQALVRQASRDQRIEVNGQDVAELITYISNDMLGFGPLDPLLADDTISDIMVNGWSEVYIERDGQMELTPVRFRDDQHVLNIATRIVSAAGRRIDESQPHVDARLQDGSRVNVIIPPLALDGPVITIRKFPADEMTLRDLVRNRALSGQMAQFLELATRARLNIIISGGTGAGKTTLLNAMSRGIPLTERIITIEDAAELCLQQPHVIRLETRPPNIEGAGEVTMRTLLKNALRMRPDRIIIGEVRSDEVIDLMQAMNTGHDGSMSTLHANSPREALTRMENMVAMSGISLPQEFVRNQLKDAIDIVIQISRMSDGVRRIVSISEIVGCEANTVTMQELFRFRQDTTSARQGVVGDYEYSGTKPHFTRRAEERGLGAELAAILNR